MVFRLPLFVNREDLPVWENWHLREIDMGNSGILQSGEDLPNVTLFIRSPVDNLGDSAVGLLKSQHSSQIDNSLTDISMSPYDLVRTGICY